MMRPSAYVPVLLRATRERLSGLFSEDIFGNETTKALGEQQPNKAHFDAGAIQL
jgi:hypothetical protein